MGTLKNKKGYVVDNVLFFTKEKKRDSSRNKIQTV